MESRRLQTFYPFKFSSAHMYFQPGVQSFSQELVLEGVPEISVSILKLSWWKFLVTNPTKGEKRSDIRDCSRSVLYRSSSVVLIRISRKTCKHSVRN